MGAITHNGEVLQSLPANASQVNFDKTGTNLNSTQTENAIKEVNTKVNTNTDDITQLKSGLTNYEATTNAALAMPENTGKNVLPYPFSDTTKTVNGVTFTDNGDGTISTSGTSTERTVFYIQNNNANLHIPAGIYTCSKSYQNTYTVLNVDAYNGNTWIKSLVKSSSTDDVTFTVDYDGYDRISIYLAIQTNIITDNIIFKPMIRPATITDPTFAPYIPSVESRIEAVESGLTSVGEKMITILVEYSSEYSYFPITGDTPEPVSGAQVSLVGRNIRNGALYVLWYDTAVKAFRVGGTIAGDAPQNDDTLYVQYFA